MASVLTDKELYEIEEFKRTSLTTIQSEFRSSSSLRPLVEYTNQLLRIVLFPLTFFKYEREIGDTEQDIYKELKKILNYVHTTYFEGIFEPIDLVLFMCGFEPVCAKQEPGITPEDVTQTEPMLKNTTKIHRDYFTDLQGIGRYFLQILSAFGPFNAYLTQIYKNRHSSSQPYIVALGLSVGEHYNEKFKSIIDKLFITDDEGRNPEFSNQNNSMYMTKLKTGRVMKLFGILDEEVTSILSSFSGGRRTSRRKQTKSRNPRKRKSTKQRRRKSMKYRKS